jgi:peptide-methionine (S)-S-oxide reductase
MGTFTTRASLALIIGATLACGQLMANAAPVPPPAVDAALAAKPGRAIAVLAGVCVWRVQAVFQHTRGVIHATSGYAGGSAANAQYETVSSGTTGHAESVQITYDPSVITYGQLLRVFFSVAHDPTQLNQQGPDVGTQYRSNVFTADAEQERIARAYVQQLDSVKAFSRPIVTMISPLTKFYEAEAYHQDYATLHPDDLYIRINDAPKVENLRKSLPEFYVAAKAK